MFNRKIRLDKVKLITTPSSLKILKFAKKYSGIMGDKSKAEKKSYEKWLKSAGSIFGSKVGSIFGVVKTDIPSPFLDYHQMSYQMLNTLPLEKDEIGTIHINDDGSFEYGGLLARQLEIVEKLTNDMSYFCKFIERNTKKEEPGYNPRDCFLYNLLKMNAETWDTEFVKKYVADFTYAYIKRLHNGKIQIKHSDYAVMLGNPYEMLQAATMKPGAFLKAAALGTVCRPLKDYQVFCPKYNDGQELVGFRNPHICSGNILIGRNTYRRLLIKYFNLTENIVITNAWDSDLLPRLQGADYDSDSIIFHCNPVLLKAAKQCRDSNEFRIPVCGLESRIIDRRYGYADEVKIDNAIAENLIGQIINLSQMFNSHYWDEQKRNEEGRQKTIYNCICMLSSLSQVEIDKPKKDCEVNVNGFLHTIGNAKFDDGTVIIETGKIQRKRMAEQNAEKYSRLKAEGASDERILDELGETAQIRPNFFSMLGKSNRFIHRPFDTPMDYLHSILCSRPRKKKTSKRLLRDMIVSSKSSNQQTDYRQIGRIMNICQQRCRDSIGAMSTSDDHAEKQEKLKEMFDLAHDALARIKINEKTMREIISRALSNENSSGTNLDKAKFKDFSRICRPLLTDLYMAHPDTFEACFKDG